MKIWSIANSQENYTALFENFGSISYGWENGFGRKDPGMAGAGSADERDVFESRAFVVPSAGEACPKSGALSSPGPGMLFPYQLAGAWITEATPPC